MSFGKTIKLFLIDGESNGRITSELSNWSGKAYKIPRIKIRHCSDRPDLKNPGIYFLFGKDEKDNDSIYIGEAETIYNRLIQHLALKDFWNEAIVFISKDENLNKAHIKYLESRFYEISKNVNRYYLMNNSIPTRSSIAESDKAEMEEFISNVKVLINVLGHKVFEEKRESESNSKNEIFFISTTRGAQAQGRLTSDGFVVLKSSLAEVTTSPSMFKNLLQHREKLIEDGKLIKNNESYMFTEDCVFSSPSTAAAVVLGRTANGLLEWKLKNGTSLQDFETNNNR